MSTSGRRDEGSGSGDRARASEAVWWAVATRWVSQPWLKFIILIIKANMDVGLGGGEVGNVSVGVPVSDP